MANEKRREYHTEYMRKYRERNLEKIRAAQAFYKQRWYAANHERALENSRRWYKENAERVNAQTRERRRLNPESFREYDRQRYQKNPNRNRSLSFRSKYGISVAEYEHLYKIQGGVCAACKEIETALHANRKVRRLAVDHNHTTGQVRGLLCQSCNVALAMARESPSRLRGIAAYIELWQ